jgi:hypothetical protein
MYQQLDTLNTLSRQDKISLTRKGILAGANPKSQTSRENFK